MNYCNDPLITIITVVRNGAFTIEKTLASVRAQFNVGVEHVIIDGASTDGTIDIIKTYQRDQLRWISEPDLGIYDAMNKGISLARGEWLLFLGADDVLVDSQVLADIFQSSQLGAYDIVCGRSRYTGGLVCVPRLDWHTQIFNTIQHQAVFYRRSLFTEFRYRLDIPVVADYEMNFFAYRNRVPTLFLSRHIALCGNMGISHTSNQTSNHFDAYRIRKSYINRALNICLLSLALLDLLLVRVKRHR